MAQPPAAAAAPPTAAATVTGGATEQELKALRAAKEEAHLQEIYSNFATPLVGTFLNLPRESVPLKCPACGVRGPSEVRNDLKWWAVEVNRIVGCLFVSFCLCCCFNYPIASKATDCNHYCKNCGCYFGRSMKYAPLKVLKDRK